MNRNSRLFKAVDILLIALMIAPILVAITLKVLFTPASEGIAITGARIYFTIPMPIQDLPITEAQINSWLVMISIFALCLYLTHGLSVKSPTKRQLVIEWAIEKAQAMVNDSMGLIFSSFTPFIMAILALSGFSSLLSLFGLFPPTSDINIVGGWAVLVFALITYYKFKCGPVEYLKSFTQPVALTPLNIISEVATPLSMAFRHYGNVLSGTVIAVLVATGLGGLSHLVLGWIPIIGEIPLLQIGLPAILSIYFDVFSGLLQAYIFAMLTMMYVSGAFPAEKYEERKKLRAQRKKEKSKSSNENLEVN